MPSLNIAKKFSTVYIIIGIFQWSAYSMLDNKAIAYIFAIIGILLGVCSIIIGKRCFSNTLNLSKLFISNGIWLVIGILIFCLLNPYNLIHILIPLSIIIAGARLYLVSVSILDKSSFLYGKQIYLPSAYCIVLLLIVVPKIVANSDDYIDTSVESNSVKEILINGEIVPFVDGYMSDMAVNADTVYIDVKVLDGWEVQSVTYAVVDDTNIKVESTNEEKYITTDLSNQMLPNSNKVDLLQPVKMGECSTYFYIQVKNITSQETVTHIISCNAYDTLAVYCEKINFNTSFIANQKIYTNNNFEEIQKEIKFSLKPFNTEGFYNRKTLAVALIFAIGQYNAECRLANGYKYEIIDDVIYINVRKDSAVTDITFESSGGNSWVKWITL